MFSVAVAVLLALAGGVQMWILGLFSTSDPDQPGDANRDAAVPNPWEQPEPVAVAGVSVLICAANEADNLERFLPGILEQAYRDDEGRPRFEVIVVNDRSSDASGDVLERLATAHRHLKIVTVAPDVARRFPGKKDALSRGLEAAAHEIILMTDADCRPLSPHWITWMAYPFARGCDIVGGYGGYDSAPGFLNRFIQSETIHTFAQYHGYSERGTHYMAVGRNLACKKELLLRAQEDPLWTRTASGDDDMLIRICATPENMVVIDHPQSHTYSPAKSGWGEYLRQKQRHMSTGKLYRPPVKRLLGAYALSHSLCWILLLCCLCELVDGQYSLNAIYGWAVTIGMTVIIRFCWFSSYLASVAEALSSENRRLRYFWPIFDFMWMIYNIILSPYILWKSRQRWK